MVVRGRDVSNRWGVDLDGRIVVEHHGVRPSSIRILPIDYLGLVLDDWIHGVVYSHFLIS